MNLVSVSTIAFSVEAPRISPCCASHLLVQKAKVLAPAISRR